MVNEPLSNNEQICPKCNSPLTPGLKFCETCGAKIEQPPVCAHCGEPLTVGVKFCESCGKPVAAPAAPTVPAEPPTPAQVTVPVTPAAKPPAPTPEEVKKPELKSKPEPKAAAKEKVPDKKAPEKRNEPVTKAPAKAVPAPRTQTLMFAGVVGLVIVVALAYFVLLPMLSGSGTPGSGNSATPLGATLVPSTASTVAPAQSSASASYVLEPTQVPPTNLLVYYEVERDPITGLVTVTFRGGAGQYGVSDVSIRLTRSDGEVLTQSFKPQQIGSFTTLKGTLMTDHIEVTANYYNGEKYRIIDQLFEYKKKF
ncbi:MAG: zinc ribbon domain-containing protein [Methanoregula sp.]|nr:zinc ribbon domain-containing protein [Methanoregula sp.]